MVAITGPHLSRRAEVLGLATCALAAVVVVLMPALYLVVLSCACAAMATVAPPGRRTLAALAVWLPVSAAVLLSTTLPA
ncbi:MAG: hypothetical protein U5K30_04590 [Acidimicrobiales bacterium]|nr:hypothetical protein [Acidimicrobiales bacterium]